jgi:hypothetical protein
MMMRRRRRRMKKNSLHWMMNKIKRVDYELIIQMLMVLMNHFQFD